MNCRKIKKVSVNCDAEGGFTLIEMMIAMVVIMFGLVSVVGLAVYVSRTNATSNALNVLAAAAQDQVDRMRTAIWTRTTEDPTLSVGGSLSSSTPAPVESDPVAPTADTTPFSSGTVQMSIGDVETDLFLYELDPDDPHHATVSNTPVGDLDIRWQIRQGSTDDLRYVTIKVVQINAPPLLSNGFMVTTILSRD